jgi:hypothetical protein
VQGDVHGGARGGFLWEAPGEFPDEPFERDLYELVGRAGEFLFQMLDPQSGHVPLYGNNDGAHILPLNECDFLDFRPVIQAVHYLAHRQRCLPAG